MGRVFRSSIMIVLLLVMAGCDISEPPEIAGPQAAVPPGEGSSESVHSRIDITGIVSFLDAFNQEVDDALQMADYEVEAAEGPGGLLYADNGVYRIAFSLGDEGEVKSALYQDGLDEAQRDVVAKALLKTMSSPSFSARTQDPLWEEAERNRESNDAYTQDMVDAMEGFGSSSGSAGNTQGKPEVSLPESELSSPEPFAQDQLSRPEVSAPAAPSQPQNPNDTGLPEIGNFGKLPE